MAEIHCELPATVHTICLERRKKKIIIGVSFECNPPYVTVFLSCFGAFLTSLFTFAQQLMQVSKQLIQTAGCST